MTALLTVIHVTICVLLILAVLMQSGKGGGLAASVGGGLSSSSVLGGRAATSFLEMVFFPGESIPNLLHAGVIITCLLYLRLVPHLIPCMSKFQ